jgi:hypothetical protein
MDEDFWMEIESDIDSIIARNKIADAGKGIDGWNTFEFDETMIEVTKNPRFECLTYLEQIEEAIECYAADLRNLRRWRDVKSVRPSKSGAEAQPECDRSDSDSESGPDASDDDPTDVPN